MARPDLRVQRPRPAFGGALTLLALGAICLILIAATSIGTAAKEQGLRVKAAHLQYLADMSPLWNLEVNDPGTSTLLLYSQLEAGAKPVVIAPDRLSALRAALAKERFFDLKDSYGDAPIHGPSRTMDVWLDGRHKTVKLLTIELAPNGSSGERAEIDRALRVWVAIRDCFDAPGALDSREDDRRFLAASRSAA